MTDLRTAAQQALEALEYHVEQTRPIHRTSETITALRAALAEDARDWSLLEATQESLREHMAEIQQMRATLAQVLAAMATCVSSSDGEDSWFDHDQVYAARNAARAVMAKPATIAEWWAAKQADSGEPVAWQAVGGSIWAHKTSEDDRPLYAASQPAPARVPLTDEQILNIIDDVLEGGSLVDVARAIEAAHGITTKD